MLEFDNPTLVTITAPTCSGKNYLRDALKDAFGWTTIVSTTTRAKRAGEVDGVDYHFISENESQELEAEGLFAELIEFRGVRYGVTHHEMRNKMAGPTPMVVLEPVGLGVYTQMCAANGWDIFKIYIHTAEQLRLERLENRMLVDILNGVDPKIATAIHDDRVASIRGDERRWSNQSTWDAIVPGDDLDKALSMIEHGVKWRNRRSAKPVPYVHTV